MCIPNERHSCFRTFFRKLIPLNLFAALTLHIKCGFEALTVEVALKNFALLKSGVALWLRLSRLPKKTSTPKNQVWLCGFDSRGCRKKLRPPEIRCGFVASTVEVAEKYFALPKSGVALWLRQSRLPKKL